MISRLLAAAGLVALAPTAFTPSANALAIDWAQVGAPGNACEVQPATPSDPGGCFGGVADLYAISRTEVTNAQYAEFLNAVAAEDPNALYSTEMAGGFGGITRSGSPGTYSYATVAGREIKPVNNVSWYDALRFVNWLGHGQPSGPQGPATTEAGTYTLMGPTSLTGGRAPGASIFLPNEDEWYKAAYYAPALTGYYDFPAGSDDPTACATAGATANTANCNVAASNTTNVGAYTGSASPFRTFDQGGNVYEWTETAIGPNSVARGGSWTGTPALLAAADRIDIDPSQEDIAFGFRVGAVPEPGTGLLVMAGMVGLAGWRRRSIA